MMSGFREQFKRDPFLFQRGFSFVEMMIVLAIIGVMAAIMLPTMRNVIPSSQASIAETKLNILNQAVQKFNQARWELILTNGATTNAEFIARSLQYRGPESTAAVGSPYLDPMLTIISTDDAKTYRAVWNGYLYQLAPAGTTGYGLDLLNMTSSGTSYSFAANFKPCGSP